MQRDVLKQGSSSLAETVRDYPFSTDTDVAFVTAKTLLPSFRFIRPTDPVVIIDVTIPAAVRMTTCPIRFSIVPGKRFRIPIDLRERSSDVATMSAVEYD